MILQPGQCLLYSGTVVDDVDNSGQDLIDVLAPPRWPVDLPLRCISPLPGTGRRHVPAKGSAVSLFEFPNGKVFYASSPVVSTQWAESIERVGFEGRGGTILVGIESVLKEVHLGGFDAPEQATCWAPLKAIVGPHNEVLTSLNALVTALKNTLNGMVPGSGDAMLLAAGYVSATVTTKLTNAGTAISADSPASDVVRLLKAKPT